MTSVFETSVMYVPGVGPLRAKILEKEINVKTFSDLLKYFPIRYIDRTNFQAISDIQYDSAYVQIRGVVTDMRIVGATGKGRNQRLSVQFSDNTGSIELLFFKGIKWLQDKLKRNEEYIVFGKPSLYNGKFNLVHPEIDLPSNTTLRGNAGLQAIYPSTENLKNGGITQKVLSKFIGEVLNKTLPTMEETLPEHLIKQLNLMPLRLAMEEVHFPKSIKTLQEAQTRLKFEELFYIQLDLLRQKSVRLRGGNGIRFMKIGDAFNNCYKSLPYSLTEAQKRVIREMRADMCSGSQMNRLLQGDVGSGKTLVALLCALIAVDNGYQACIMAPTEILAQQHAASIGKMLEGQNVAVELLTGSTKKSAREDIFARLQNGDVNILIGTHALIEDNVIFKQLGLVVIDEQHRFGVEQRAKLWRKNSVQPPHILVMTATPIPRTLAMTLYGDLDVSVIDQLPPGRQPIKTMMFNASKRDSVFSFMRRQIEDGRQIYVVYPLIHESEKMDYENLEKGYEAIIRAFPAPKYKTAVVHGKQSAADKAIDMDIFAKGSANILVATSVIEVGVDVPNATVIVIESSERFGLSQLHQLRGRVGRGKNQSYCILLTGNKLTKEAKSRLELMCETNNGFELAEADMRMRGPGDLDGTQQSGLSVELKIANLSKDGRILEWSREIAQKVLDDDALLEKGKNKTLKEVLSTMKTTIEDYSKIS